MALDESIENLEEMQSNGITAFVDSKLSGLLKQFGDIHIDYISNAMQGSGFIIKVGNQDYSSKGCSC